MSKAVRFLFISILGILLISFHLNAQTVHQVAEGTDVLKAAIDAASPGDIIELTTSGGAYLSNDQIVLDKDLTIRAAEGLAAKPVLKYIGTSTGAYMFKVINSPKVIFKGIEFDGDGTAEGGAAKAKYALRLDNADTLGTMIVKVMDCYLHDFNEKIIKPYANCGIDSLVVHNSTFANGAKEGVTLYTGSTSDPAVRLKYAEFENCTFYGFAREGIKGDTNPNTVVRVNHCTFYDCGGTSKGMIYFDDMTDVEVKNSLFVHNGYGSYFSRFESSDNLFHHNAVWDAVNWKVSSATVSDTLHVDPMFADPANGDFTLAETSPVLGMADDGHAMGDLRWDPQYLMPKVIKVDAGTDVLKPAIDSAEPGDIIELVTSGGLYLSSDQIEIDKDITIRAAEGLYAKPILKYIGTSTGAYMFKVINSPKVVFKGIEFDGDGTAEGGAALAKYALRLDNADTSGTMIVKVMDCELHDFNEKIIKPYKNCGIDSLIVHNSTFYNGAKEGVTLYSGSSSDPAVQMKYAEFENCTFYGFVREGIKGDTNPNTIVRVNHCTFYDCGGSSKGMIYFDDMTDVEVKNSLFVHNSYGSYFSRFESADNLFHHNAVWDVVSWEASSATVSDTFHVDPMFADPANGDFTLDPTSPVFNLGDDGQPLGDLRWTEHPGQFLLAISVEGSGTVTADPAGPYYDPGTVVTLTATPSAGWKFVGWEGAAAFPPDNPTATVTMDDNKTVKAIFETAVPKYTVNAGVEGIGHVEFSPEPLEGNRYDEGTAVTLTAVPDSSTWEFVEWTGDTSSTDNPFTFTIMHDMNLTAHFRSTLPQVVLDVDTVGLGGVTVSPQPILGTYDTLTTVVLTATPLQGWEFTGWTGDLVSNENPDTLVLDGDKHVIANFGEIQTGSHVLEIDSTWDLRDAVEFANNNSNIDTIMLTTPGVYTSTSTSNVEIRKPLTIMAKPGLSEKPIVTNSDPEASNLDIFRVFDSFTLIGVHVDGGNARTYGMKYGVRLSNYTDGDTVRWGADITLKDCDFVNLYQGKDVKHGDGHAFKIDKNVRAGVVKIENCTFANIGYEAIRISDTEKWPTDRALDSLIVRNCTFTNIDAEAVRYYSDKDTNTVDAPVIIEHITVNNSATRAFYLKNSGGAIVRDVIIANSRLSDVGRDADLMDAQGKGTVVSHIDTFNVRSVPIKASKGGMVDEETVWGIDPKFEDAQNMDYTLLPESHLYGLAHDGQALGDLRWATKTPVNKMLTIIIEGNGSVELDPQPVGKTYDPGTEVTLTAIPDSGYVFKEWKGAVTGSDNPVKVTMDNDKTITAVFEVETAVSDKQNLPVEYALYQNYPNPFNPTTTIAFDLKESGRVTLKIFDVSGREVAKVINQRMKAGHHKVVFYNPEMASGIYFYQIKAGKFSAIKKMLLVK